MMKDSTMTQLPPPPPDDETPITESTVTSESESTPTSEVPVRLAGYKHGFREVDIQSLPEGYQPAQSTALFPHVRVASTDTPTSPSRLSSVGAGVAVSGTTSGDYVQLLGSCRTCSRGVRRVTHSVERGIKVDPWTHIVKTEATDHPITEVL
jgi:hypothetical protein